MSKVFVKMAFVMLLTWLMPYGAQAQKKAKSLSQPEKDFEIFWTTFGNSYVF